jgi:hypothetical protein
LYEKISGKSVTVAVEISVIDIGISLQIENQKKDDVGWVYVSIAGDSFQRQSRLW